MAGTRKHYALVAAGALILSLTVAAPDYMAPKLVPAVLKSFMQVILGSCGFVFSGQKLPDWVLLSLFLFSMVAMLAVLFYIYSIAIKSIINADAIEDYAIIDGVRWRWEKPRMTNKPYPICPACDGRLIYTDKPYRITGLVLYCKNCNCVVSETGYLSRLDHVDEVKREFIRRDKVIMGADHQDKKLLR